MPLSPRSGLVRAVALIVVVWGTGACDAKPAAPPSAVAPPVRAGAPVVEPAPTPAPPRPRPPELAHVTLKVLGMT